MSLIADPVTQLEISTNRYLVRLARNEKEVDEALKLRFEIFGKELGLEHAYIEGRDRDIYDSQFDHLLVFDKRSNLVIGTYRAQTRAMAEEGCGFASATEFDISRFPEAFLDEAIEVGRSCIAMKYRKGSVLYLLWKALARYLTLRGKRYLFGCCSLKSQDVHEGMAIQRYLEARGHIHPTLNIPPLPEFNCYPEEGELKHEKVKIPELMRLYLQLGARVCGAPAIDRSYKTIDFMVVLDRNKVDKKRYGDFK
ncbi:MAG: GNAT family N-acetyltransferase [Deltaproteobacteria bacterium]|nr:GNAT family N-acetyltransferase [Deltaproteobacteria bacterium]